MLTCVHAVADRALRVDSNVLGMSCHKTNPTCPHLSGTPSGLCHTTSWVGQVATVVQIEVPAFSRKFITGTQPCSAHRRLRLAVVADGMRVRPKFLQVRI